MLLVRIVKLGFYLLFYDLVSSKSLNEKNLYKMYLQKKKKKYFQNAWC